MKGSSDTRKPPTKRDRLSDIARLHNISRRIVPPDRLQNFFDETLLTAITITDADMGNIQLLDPESGALKIIAQRGFDRAFCEFFDTVHRGQVACGTALQQGQRVIVEDVTQSPIFADTAVLEVMLLAGVRAVQSTPILSRSGNLLGMFSTHYRAPHDPGQSELQLLDLLVRQTADFIDHTQMEAILRSSQAELQSLTSRLQQAAERERAMLAREIHDELSGALTALKMDLALMADRTAKTQKWFQLKLRSMSELIDGTLARVQSIVTDLRPVVLDKFGLLAAIEWQARNFQERSGISCEIDLPADEMSLDYDRSTAVFRIFQEALTNVSRHAKATRVMVSLRNEKETLMLEVCDNGKGINETDIFSPNSFGLLGMRERALTFGGVVEICCLREGGTKVSMRVPIAPAEA